VSQQHVNKQVAEEEEDDPEEEMEEGAGRGLPPSMSRVSIFEPTKKTCV
jgi:hypothetical protein